MKKTPCHTFLIATMLLTQGLAPADPVSDAQLVIQHRMAMTNPTNVFDKWQADQWTFAAIQCGRVAGLKKELDGVAKLPVYLSGSNSSPSDVPAYCATLATSGPAAECFEMSTAQPPFTMPTAGLPSNYLFLRSTADAKEGSQHMVGGYCNLVKNTSNTRQFFAGYGTLKWLSAPRPQSFQTASGQRTLNAGTVSLSVDGMRGLAMPRTVIVQDQ